MKDAHREKLRQLPRERKLYLLQQNQHIKENRAVDSSLRKSMPTSNSSTSIFPHKGLRTKTAAAMKRSETSGRLLMGNSASHRSLATSLIANSSIEDLSALPVHEETATATTTTPPSPMPTPTSPHFPSHQQQQQRYQQGGQKKNNQSNHINKKEASIHLKQPGATDVNTTPIAKSPTASENAPSTAAAKSVSISSPPTSPTTTTSTQGAMVDKRAATYKYARKNLTSTIRSNRSKVGSMVLEFDALANKLEDTASDESAAWLLLDNKTLPRHYNMNTGTTRSNHINHHPSVSNLFPTASTTTINTPSETTSSVHVAETSASSSLLSNSYAYQSLSRKDGSHLASLVSSSSPALDDTIKRGRDRNSPYYYVERIKSR